ncbi:hypothetical protein HMN09_00589300 [Mycena chlorophos]|uniref:DUF6699 domain-containing protein n=1 Tax=Mycena chlorophos TaxID=658473 RepID=A0A8H6W996_MYCCL|nr:hypothetical protein HMN09_00589300 [Mycena chlorophos]
MATRLILNPNHIHLPQPTHTNNTSTTMPGKHVHFADDCPDTPSPSFSTSSLPSSYGPATPPQANYQYLPMVGAPSPHRILQYAGPTTTNLIYNVTLPAANVVPGKLNMGMQASVLSEPATSPPLPLITLVHPRLGGGWKIVCKPSDGTSNFVRVADVLEAIYVSLRQNVTGADYDRLPSAVAKAEVTKAFTKRYSTMPDAPRQLAEMNKGLKRVDWLGALTRFAGIAPSATVPGAFDLLLI